MRVRRHAAHRHLPPLMLAAEGERDIERFRCRFRIVEEHLVEIAHAEEDQRIRMRGLGGEPLRHGGRGSRGGQRLGGSIVHCLGC
jgi:hypothetical protein